MIMASIFKELRPENFWCKGGKQKGLNDVARYCPDVIVNVHRNGSDAIIVDFEYIPCSAH